MERRSPFRKRTLVLILIFGVGSLLFSVGLGWVTDEREQVESIDTDTFSTSAIGHQALLRLSRSDAALDVEISRYKTRERAARGAGLILAEPHLMKGGDEELGRRARQMLASSPNTLLVLPKRDGVQDDLEKDWVGAVFFVPEYDVRHVLEQAGLGAIVPRRTFTHSNQMSWRALAPKLAHTPTIPDVQLLPPSPMLRPLIETDQGTLLAEAVGPSAAGGRLLVLSDPDVLANHGLHEGENAALTLAILRHLRQDRRGELVLDEITHGWRLVPSLYDQLLRFPLVLATAQVALLILLMVWAGIGRFGPPRRSEAGLAPGKDFFIDHTAELLTFGGHSSHTAERYVWMVLRDLSAALHAPGRLSRPELVEWLQGQADQRGVSIDLEEVARQAARLASRDKKARAQKLLALALKLYRFRRDMLT